MSRPWYAVGVSVVGTPDVSIAQPAGICGAPSKNALKILPTATVVVAMSSSHGRPASPGTDTQIGLVPTRPSHPCQGGTMGLALHITTPIKPSAEILCAQN